MIEQDLFREQLEKAGINAHEAIGQNFLIDNNCLTTIASFVSNGSTVIEIGSGPGNLTTLLAQRAEKVIGFEIDKQFQPLLDDVQAKYKNVEIVYTDAVRTIEKYIGNNSSSDSNIQVIANIPFHITEPLLTKLIGLNISDITLLLGNNVVREIQESPNSWGFGKLSLLAQTFYDINIVTNVPKNSFYPQPRTNASVVTFFPKNKREINNSRSNSIFAKLFKNANRSGLIVNEIKQALVESGSDYGTLDKHEFHRRDRANVRRQLKNMRDSGNFDFHKNKGKNKMVLSQSHALELISKMGLSESVLNKPFFRLDNQEIRELTLAVREYFG